MKSPFFRFLICFCLICCLLFQCFPPPAEAVDPFTMGVIGAGVLVPILLAWAGVTADPAKPEVFQNVNSSLTSHLKGMGYITGDMMQIMNVVTTPGMAKTYVPGHLLQHVLDWLWDSGTVKQITVSGSSISTYEHIYSYNKAPEYGWVDTQLGYSDFYPRVYFYRDKGFAIHVDHRSPGYDYIEGFSSSFYLDQNGNWVTTGGNKDWRIIGSYQILRRGVDDVPHTDAGLIDGNLALKGDSYDTIAEHKAEIIEFPTPPQEFPEDPDPEPNPDPQKPLRKPAIVPINPDWVPGGGQSDAQAPQEKPWSPPDPHPNPDPGTDPDPTSPVTPDPGTDPDPEPDPHPNPDPHPDPDPNPDPHPNPDPEPDPGTDPSSPVDPGAGAEKEPPSFDNMVLDLRKFFPFCIPFDIYDFFHLLAAEPVTPSFTWDMPLPTGGVYTWEIDLKDFDGVAAVCRKLMALAFLIGLAVKTRDLIKG